MEITRRKFWRPHGYGLSSKDDGTYKQVDGSVDTQHGYVRVYSEDSPNYHITSLMMTIAGHAYQATIQRFYTARGCVTLAARFADECAAQGANDE